MAKEEQIKTSIDLTGEKEYRAACNSINSSLREINSEMKLATAEFADNASGAEALTKKQEILQKQLTEQAKKAEAAEEALKKMREAGIDPTDPAYQKMQTNLNNTKAEMAKTEKQIKSTSEELKSSKVNWEAVGETVGKVGKAFGAALAALGAAAVGAASALAGLTVSASNYADDLITQATFTRQTTDDLQKYAYAARFIDVEVNTLTKSMAKNIKSMDSARKGSAEYADAYKKLGVSVTDANGELRNSNDVYWDCIDALGSIQNETERDALAMQLFGKSAQELNSVIEAGSEAFKELGDEAEQMGFILSEDAVNRLGAFNDKLQVLQAGAEGLKNAASLIALPFLDTLAGEGIPIMTKFSKAVMDAEGDVTKMADALGEGISDVLNLIVEKLPEFIDMGVQLFVALIQNLPTIIVEIVKAVPQIVSGIVQAFASLGGELVNAGANLLHGLWEGISGAASWLWEKVSGWASSLVSGIKDFFGIHSPSTVFAEIGGNMADGVGVGFTDNMGGVEGDMTAAMGGAGALTAAEAVNAVNNGIIANIEGLSGAVNAIVERVITGLTAQAQRFNQAGQDFDKNIASGMVTAIVQITQKIPQIVQSIITAFTAQHQKFVTEGTNIDKSIAQGMIAGIPQITGKVAQIVQPIITALRSYVSEFTAAGEEMVRGIWQGFQNMSGWLESKVRSMMREIVAAVEAEMQINSPSKVFARIGSYMAQGLGEGFAREMRDVESTIRRETSNAVPEFRSGEGRDKRGGGTPSVEVVQNIYANETSYAEQQRQAARQFRQIAREVMA